MASKRSAGSTNAKKKAAAKKKAPARSKKAAAPKKKAAAKKAPAKKKAAAKKKQKAPANKSTTAKKKAPARKRAARGMSQKFLEEQRKALVAERTTYLRQADTLRAEAEALANDMEPGDVQFDEESGEGATVAVERERDLALSAQARAEIEDIDSALARIDDGTYGVCRQCEQPIPKERLRALPQAALCVSCKSGGFGRR